MTATPEDRARWRRWMEEVLPPDDDTAVGAVDEGLLGDLPPVQAALARDAAGLAAAELAAIVATPRRPAKRRRS